MNIIKNEKGVALVLAMIMIVLMSILGAFALSTSTTEIAISGNYRNSQDAFYAADSAVEYISIDGNIYNRDLAAFPVNLNTADAGVYLTNTSINNNGRVSGLDTSATNNVTYITCGALPAGSGYETSAALAGSGGSGYNNANYFLITVTTTGPSGSQSSIEAQIAKPVTDCPS